MTKRTPLNEFLKSGRMNQPQLARAIGQTKQNISLLTRQENVFVVEEKTPEGVVLTVQAIKRIGSPALLDK